MISRRVLRGGHLRLRGTRPAGPAGQRARASAAHQSGPRRELSFLRASLSGSQQCGDHRPVPGPPDERLGVTFDNFYADLRAEPAATELATRREQLIQDTTLAREQQREEARRFAFLRDHFLASPQMARLWWLNNDPEKLLSSVKKSGETLNAVALLDGREADLGQGDHIAQIIETFVAELPPEHRQHLITQIGLVFRGYERADLADRLDDQYPGHGLPGSELARRRSRDAGRRAPVRAERLRTGKAPGISADRREQDEYFGSFNATKTGFWLMSLRSWSKTAVITTFSDQRWRPAAIPNRIAARAAARRR